jgi:hypothetical protein
MRVPQVSDRIKEAPAQALRGVFAGIGQLLLITDKLRNKTPASQQAPQARAPGPSETRAEPVPTVQQAPSAPSASSAPPAPPAPSASSASSASSVPTARAADKVPEARDFDKTGNVRLLTSEKAGADNTVPTVDATAASEVAAVAEDAALTTKTEPGAPLPNYDELSIASLRARLRNLDVAQVRQLLVYEQAHAARADVMAMFERRITKLEAKNADERGEAEAEAEAEAQDEVDTEVQDDVEAEAEGET